jgi:hypothetical protein
VLIKRRDYERIYRIINSLLISVGANPTVACTYFAAIGAYILEKHFNINAELKGGFAAYCLGNSNILAFGHCDGKTVDLESESFHCWLEADGWVIDFMAPSFSELDTPNAKIESKMFQRRLSEMVSSVKDIRKSGDFYFESTHTSTRKSMQAMGTEQIHEDLAEIAVMWFQRVPKKIQGSKTIFNRNGDKMTIDLIGQPLTGNW